VRRNPALSEDSIQGAEIVLHPAREESFGDRFEQAG
jgi:hypothetical protein